MKMFPFLPRFCIPENLPTYAQMKMICGISIWTWSRKNLKGRTFSLGCMGRPFKFLFFVQIYFGISCPQSSYRTTTFRTLLPAPFSNRTI